jgi:hypothetical protein
MLAESGEQGSVAGALRRREIPRLEAAGTVTRERGLGHEAGQSSDSDSLSSLGLLCRVAPDIVLFGFRAAASSSSRRSLFSRRLVNVAALMLAKRMCHLMQLFTEWQCHISTLLCGQHSMGRRP